ncbi:sulfite exporter TauE/SafE family protein [Methylocystis sp. WRRC1]|uniref:sulfite exporter TauE/SafE family protein n=1 Tax=unclassified Methylocystis TaxID=2625913 RepID=UPI0001F870DE|nr:MULTISPECIES: sulfite exporter TauE/SafE family protein [unclassified Methylocystis]MCC3245676.1 sulfite exporter TauE/SafE family protein [Methylocystis sp. WRRC1]
MTLASPELLQLGAAVLSGVFVGFSLGLVGGGGSVLAVPLLVYFVGVGDPHVAIGTSAVAVAANALASLGNHARAGTIKWRCASVFALFGVAGAFGGSTLGKMLDGQKLLALFGLLMLVVGAVMFRRRGGEGFHAVRLNRDNFPRLAALGLVIGGLSGFFGIGGGFLVVPGLMLASDMPILYAIGSSLVSVTAFGVTTAGNYALSGLVDWPLAGGILGGGVIGGMIGAATGRRLSTQRGALAAVFAMIIVAVAIYVLWRSAAALGLLELAKDWLSTPSAPR